MGVSYLLCNDYPNSHWCRICVGDVTMNYIRQNWFEFSTIIDEDGILLDDSGNELRDEEGQIICIPKREWKYCKQILDLKTSKETA